MASKIKLPYDITITTPIADIEKMMKIAIRDELNKVIPSLLPAIKSDIVAGSRKFFTSSPEYNALINGPLDAHFGIPHGEAVGRLNRIIDTILGNIDVSFTRISVTAAGFNGGINVGVVVSDYSDILSLGDSVIITDKGQTLHWLEWLLKEGNRIIISSYEFLPGSFSTSRSGMGIMAKNNIKFWKVPAAYSGTVRNNWLTRAVIDVGGHYVDFISDIIEKHVS